MKELFQSIIYNQSRKRRYNPSKFKYSKKIFKKQQVNINYIRNRLKSYISPNFYQEENFESWEEIYFCLQNPQINNGKEAPNEFYYLTQDGEYNFGLIGHILLYEKVPYKDTILSLPCLVKPTFAVFLHPYLSKYFLEGNFKETQLDNILKKTKGSNAFETKNLVASNINFFHNHLKNLSDKKKDSCTLFFGNIDHDLNSVSLMETEQGSIVPFNPIINEEVLIDIRNLPDKTYCLINEAMQNIGEITVKSGEVKKRIIF